MDRDAIMALVAEKKDDLLYEISNYRYAAENGTIGDYGDLGFLMELVTILTRGDDQ